MTDRTREIAEDIAKTLSAPSEVIDDPNGDGSLVVIRGDELSEKVYVVAVDGEGRTTSATIDRDSFDSNPAWAMEEADWESGIA